MTDRIEGTSTTSTLFADFDRFWRLYPRKVKKLAAERAYMTARKRASAEDIIDGLLHYPFSSETRYQDHAATWLNGGGWMVEADTAPPTIIVSKVESDVRTFERMLGIGE